MTDILFEFGGKGWGWGGGMAEVSKIFANFMRFKFSMNHFDRKFFVEKYTFRTISLVSTQKKSFVEEFCFVPEKFDYLCHVSEL